MIGTFIDLTHTVDPSIPTWNGSCGFSAEIKMDYAKGCRVMKYSMHGGIGTHIDAPCHFFPNALSTADLSLKNLIVPVCVLDISDKAHGDTLLSLEDLQNFENEMGRIREGCLFLAYTGWEKFWNDKDKYRNCDEFGRMHYPGFSKEAALFLLERKVVGIGIDTLSPDGTNQGFPVHEVILGADKYILENVANLQKMPPIGALAFILPMKIAEGAEAPVRAVGLIPER